MASPGKRKGTGEKSQAAAQSHGVTTAMHPQLRVCFLPVTKVVTKEITKEVIKEGGVVTYHTHCAYHC